MSTATPPPITTTPSFGNDSASSKSKKKSKKSATAESTEDEKTTGGSKADAGSNGGSAGAGVEGPIGGGEEEGEKDKNGGEGVAGIVLSKRMKKLRKQIERSSAYVDIEVAKLNKDQVAALAKLEHQKHTFAELEELKKQIDVVEMEQAGNVRAQKKSDDDARQKSSPTASSSIPTLVSFLRINSILFPSDHSGIQPSTPASLKELTGQETASIGKTAHEIVVEGKIDVAEKLLNGSEEEVLEGVTYARLASIISKFSPSSTASTESSAPESTANGVISEIASLLPTLPSAASPAAIEESIPSASKISSIASSFIPAPIASAASAATEAVFGSTSTEGAEAGSPVKEEKKDEKKEEAKEKESPKKEETAPKPKIPEPEVVIDKSDEPVGSKGMEGEGEGLDVAEEFDMGDPMEDREERASVSDDEEDKVEELKQEESAPSTSAAPLSSSIPSISIAAAAHRAPAAHVDWADDDDEFGGGLPPIPSFGERGKYIISSSPLNASSFGKNSGPAPAPPVSKWGQTAFKSNLTKASVNAKPFSPAFKPTPLAGAPSSTPSAAPSTSSPNVYVPPRTSDAPGSAPTRENLQAQARNSLRENRPSSSAPEVDEDGFVTASSGRNKKLHSGGGAGGGGGARGGRGGRAGGRGGRGRGGPRGGGAPSAAI